MPPLLALDVVITETRTQPELTLYWVKRDAIKLTAFALFVSDPETSRITAMSM